MEKFICAKCGKKTENLGGTYEDKELIYCEECSKAKELEIIKDLDDFRKSKNFHDKLALKKKILMTSEELGHIFDNSDKSHQENVSDYDELDIYELQVCILDILQSCLENYLEKNNLEKDFNEQIKKHPELEKLRFEVREQQSNKVLQINKENK